MKPISSSSDNYGIASSGVNRTYWIDSAKPILFDTLSKDLSVDVAIIGGGISGVTCAYFLANKGRRVALFEDGNLGSGETGRTTAHVTFRLDDFYFEIQSQHGEETARLVVQSHRWAVDEIGRIVEREKIDCDYRRLNGYLFLHPTDDKETLTKELSACHAAGIAECEMLQDVPGLPTEKGPCLSFPNQSQLHIIKYIHALARAAVQKGALIFTRTQAMEIDKEKVITSTNHRIQARNIIVATNTPFNDRVTMHTKQHAYRTYVIAGGVPKGSIPFSLWWDTGDKASKSLNEPYHYIRLQPYNNQSDLLIIGGEDHKTGQPLKSDNRGIEPYWRLEEWARARFPMMGQIHYHWSGQIMEPVDSLGFVGKNPGDDNIYIITGDSGNGITNGTLGARLVSDLIDNNHNPWEQVYAPTRKPLRAIKAFVQEAANMAKQYTDWVKDSDSKDWESLRPGEGAVIDKTAAYVDDDGTVHAFSAVCPHLGCILNWNRDEKSFDCPCHGSRFTCYGKVINGPANSDLELAGIPETGYNK